MRTKTIGIFKFSELSEPAKQAAKDHYAEHFGYVWNAEAMLAFDSISKDGTGWQDQDLEQLFKAVDTHANMLFERKGFNP